MKQEIKDEIKKFNIQNYIELFILNVMIVLAIFGNKGYIWGEIIYIVVVCCLMVGFILSLISKWEIKPLVIYYSIYFLHLLFCVAFGWWLMVGEWSIILICVGIGMGRYLEKEKEKNENQN